MVGGAVLQSSLVVRERETVTDLGMEVSMTDTLAVRETSCVGVTTARSLELTTILREAFKVENIIIHTFSKIKAKC